MFYINNNGTQSDDDRSPKGSVDARIQDLVDFINQHPDYVTFSSCSGRLAVFDPASSREHCWCVFGSCERCYTGGAANDDDQTAPAVTNRDDDATPTTTAKAVRVVGGLSRTMDF